MTGQDVTEEDNQINGKAHTDPSDGDESGQAMLREENMDTNDMDMSGPATMQNANEDNMQISDAEHEPNMDIPTSLE